MKKSTAAISLVLIGTGLLAVGTPLLVNGCSSDQNGAANNPARHGVGGFYLGRFLGSGGARAAGPGAGVSARGGFGGIGAAGHGVGA